MVYEFNNPQQNIQQTFKKNSKKIIENFKQDSMDDIFKLKEKNSVNSENSVGKILSNLRNKYYGLTMELGKDWHPYVNGRYMILMDSGPWINDVANLSENNFISIDTIKFIKKVVSQNSFSNLLTKIATDIDLPQINNEYMNLSTRNQAITYFLRQSFLPDFSISYIEDQQNLSIIQYHDAWFKAMELYRRGKLNNSSRLKNNEAKYVNPYFYNVPYLNGAWVVIFDIAMQIRGLIYLVGIKPVNHPLKEFLGNRSNSKMTVYNIQYKTTNMYYEFFDNTESFIQKLNNIEIESLTGGINYNDIIKGKVSSIKTNTLLKKFKEFIINRIIRSNTSEIRMGPIGGFESPNPTTVV